MSEEQVESIFQHACEGAAESIGSTRVDWQRVVDAIRFLRRELEASESLRSATISTMRRNEAQLTEARRLLDDARALVRDSCPFVPQWATVLQKRYASFLADSAAPVPAQPASPAIAAYMAAGGDEERDPIERLRFYLSCALKGRDWHDVEPFIDAISKAQPAAVPADAALADALEAASNRCHGQDVAALRKAASALRARPQAVPQHINAVYFDVPAQPRSAYVMGWNDCIDSMLAASQSATGGAT